MEMVKGTALIIRFSSIGDIAQCLGAAQYLSQQGFAVDWLTKDSFADVVRTQSQVRHVLEFKSGSGVKEIFSLSKSIFHHYELVYDAHRSLRSSLLLFMLKIRAWMNPRSPQKIIRRPSRRLAKYLSLRWKLKTLPEPYSSALEFLKPLETYFHSRSGELIIDASISRFDKKALQNVQELIPKNDFIVLLPSANYDLKRWPVEHWSQILRLNPNQNFVILGGGQDHFLDQIQSDNPKQVLNLRGKTNLTESLWILTQAKAILGNDTGLSHWADQFGLPLVLILGPTAFGRPFRKSSKTAEIELKCKPCSKFGKNPCTNAITKRCLVELKPEYVSDLLNQVLTQGQSPSRPR